MYDYTARLIRAIDGDTVVLDLDLGFYQWRLGRSYRLARINAPELNTAAGKTSLAVLVNLLDGVRVFSVTTSKADSFGRWIVELYADGHNVSDALVAAGAAEYHAYEPPSAPSERVTFTR